MVNKMAKSTNILELLDISPSIALLRARSSKIILEFLSSVFDETTAITQENLYNQLADFLDNKGIDADEEEGVFLSDTFEEKAEKYIKKWTESGFLTNYTNDDGEIYYQLSTHSSKVIEWVSSLKREEYIGTESKFKSIITQLKELVEFANEDKEKRLQLLEDKKLEIDNFKAIIKEIYRKQIDPNLNKGGILQYTFDALDELKSSSQGKSFYAFWEFLMAREMQTELDNLICELFQTLEDRNIDNDDLFLKNMVTYLHESGRKVYQSNDRMAEKLSHIIRENETSKSNLTKQTIQEIKNILIEISKSGKKPQISLEVDDGLDINIPFERKLTYDINEKREYSQMPELNTVSLEELGELGKVFGNIAVDRKVLEKNIKGILNERGQTTMSEIVKQYPLEKGLPELFAYFGVLNHFPHKSINTEKQQFIVFDYEHNKRILIPEIIISK